MQKTLVLILGPHAVGKMTVGQALAKRTGLTLFHNHMSIELVRKLFDHHTSRKEWNPLNTTIRQTVFELFAAGDFPGLIFTYMCDFDDESEFTYLSGIIDLFQNNGAVCCIVELCADFEVRLWRNKTENRLLHKESKRDIAWSEAEMLRTSAAHRLNSRSGEALPFENYLKLDNTNLTPEEAAKQIQAYFQIPASDSV